MKCSLCHNDRLEVWTGGISKYNYCSRCGVVQAFPEFFPDPEKEEERYRKHNNSITNTGYVRYLENFIASAVTPYIKEGGRILDFGCGPAPVLASLLNRKGYETAVYDPYFYPDRRWEGETFDTIVSVEVFEHLKDPAAAVKGLSGALKNGGFLIIRTLFHNENHEFFNDWWYRQDFTHITFYSKKSFKFIADICGMRLLEIRNRSEIILIKPP